MTSSKVAQSSNLGSSVCFPLPCHCNSSFTSQQATPSRFLLPPSLSLHRRTPTAQVFDTQPVERTETHGDRETWHCMAPAALLSSSGASSRATSPGLSTPSLIQHEEAEGYISDTDNTTGMHDTSAQNGSSSGCPSQGQQQQPHQFNDPIAIVGMSCRFPGGASSPAEFWELCSRARSGFRSGVPPERFDHDAFYHSNAGKIGTYHAEGGYFLDDDLATFDAPFFSLTEKEAIASKSTHNSKQLEAR